MEAVLYTQRVEIVESYQERRDCCDQRVADFISTCGFLPIPMPNRKEMTEELIETVHPRGIILTGGNSLTEYGGNAPERDAVDRLLIDLAVRNQIPLYGFCRGMQSILVYFGNKLVNVDGHVAVRHVIHTESGKHEVNSFHNQACMELKKDCGLLAAAWTEDGVIEEIRHRSLPFIGTMWHPEREKIFCKYDIERVKTLFYGK